MGETKDMPPVKRVVELTVRLLYETVNSPWVWLCLLGDSKSASPLTSC